MRQNRINTFAALSLMIFVWAGCDEQKSETPTKGNVTVLVSESVEPVLEAEQQKFQDLYPQAHVTLVPMTAREAIAHLFNDTTQLIVSSRPLNAEERDVANRSNLKFAEYKIAVDGLAFLVNNLNPVKQLRTTELDSIYTGLITRWKGVGGKAEPIILALPDQNSADFEVVGMKVLHGKRFTAPANPIKSSREMLDFVSKVPGALGVVSMSWLGEKKENVQVLDLMDPAAADSLDIKGQYFPPLQAHLYRHFYPLTSDVYIYTKADNYGVAAGFTAFITSAPGQKIVLNLGLVPATMPVRLVELTNKGEQQ